MKVHNCTSSGCKWLCEKFGELHPTSLIARNASPTRWEYGFRFKQKNDGWKFPNKVASSSRVDLNMNMHECAVVLSLQLDHILCWLRYTQNQGPICLLQTVSPIKRMNRVSFLTARMNFLLDAKSSLLHVLALFISCFFFQPPHAN